jgi:phytoene desaturase
MKQIETTQTSFNSRKSTVDNPLLFIMYLPTHTRNNTIALLQKTLKAFLEEHKLWGDYNVEYSNSSEDSGDVKEDYNAFKGNAYGLANTLTQTAVLKPTLRNKKVDNLFYAGQLTVPGPGVPPSLISGQLAAEQLLKTLK